MSTLLEVEKINSYYGDSHILFDVSLHVEQNEVVALLGRNGAGKSTTLKSLIGLVRPRSGRIMFDGVPMQGLPPHSIALSGLQLVPEDRRIFGSLSVEENLVLAGLTAKPRWPLERIWETFPRLRERRRSRGTDLSGGEQQMLAITRALLLRPRLLLLDEPSFGLAPLIVKEIFAIMRTINREEKVSILLVEQNASLALDLADHAYLIETGSLVMSGASKMIQNDESVRRSYLGY